MSCRARVGGGAHLKDLHKSNLLRGQDQAGQVLGQGQDPLANSRRKLLELLGLARQVFEDAECGVDVHGYVRCK